MQTGDVTAKLAEALRSTGLFLHHCWCDVQMNDYSFSKLNEQMKVVDEALAAYEAAQAEPKQAAEPVAWGMEDKETGLILDVICPATHDELEGDYTIPLFAAPVAQAEQWQPIETAPKDGSTIMLWERYESEPFFGFWWEGRDRWRASTTHYDTDGNACVIDRIYSDGVTHWMPLPQPPKENQP